jgi:hypothetical protein
VKRSFGELKEKRGREIAAREGRAKFQEKEGARIPRKNECTNIEEEGHTTKEGTIVLFQAIRSDLQQGRTVKVVCELGMVFKTGATLIAGCGGRTGLYRGRTGRTKCWARFPRLQQVFVGFGMIFEVH